MGQTSIEWADYTHNLWWGCDEVRDPAGVYDETVGAFLDPACHGCYARTRAENPFWWGKKELLPVWGQHVGRRFFGDDHYQEPLKWNRAAQKSGKVARVFCMSMGDWAEGREDQRPVLDKWLWPMIEETPWLVWLLLTKRPQLANSLVPAHWRENGWPSNAWPGTTAVTQKWWDIRIPHLMNIPASHTFVSVEPQTELINLRQLRPSWVICGGQSGALATALHPDFPRSLRDQCVSASVPFFFKQWGKWHPLSRIDGVHELPFGRYLTERRAGESPFGFFPGDKSSGRLLDGCEWNQMPEYHP